MIPKFRVWDGKYMEYDFFVSSHGNPYDYADVVHDTPNMEIVEAPHFKIMQSTGLKDKNGVEIFEGDIVLENGMQRVITFGEQRYEEDYGDLAYYIGFNIFTKWGYSSVVPVEHEVLGNIYENPELLEGAGNDGAVKHL